VATNCDRSSRNYETEPRLETVACQEGALVSCKALLQCFESRAILTSAALRMPSFCCGVTLVSASSSSSVRVAAVSADAASPAAMQASARLSCALADFG